MGRISATFKPTVEGMTKAYADWNGVSFSESVEILTSVSVLEWWENLPFGAKEHYEKKFKLRKSAVSLTKPTKSGGKK